MHQNATEFPSEYSPFDQNFPHVKSYNQTLNEIVRDYYCAWVSEKHDMIKTAWQEIKVANKTSLYYNLAWNNFTYAGHYINRSEIEAIYNKTDNWTNSTSKATYFYEKNGGYTGWWPENGTKAYLDAIYNARRSRGLERDKILLKTNMGDIIVELYEDMPITTGNFKKLVKQGVYNDTIFHRVIDGFMIQGGDPTGTGQGDPSIPTIPDEFTDYNRNYRGTIAMANAGPNTGSSQFFINLVNNNYLDSEHPVFGRVIEGMDVVDNIGKVETDENDRPLQDVIIIKAELVD